MQTSSKSVKCPRCSKPATLTLSETIDPVRATEGHAITLTCSNREPHPPPSEVDLLRLWAADRAAAWSATGP
jgi:hypothetical protein